MANVKQMIFRIKDVLRLTGLSNSTVKRMLAAGTFPQPAKRVGDVRKISLWTRADLERWLGAPIPDTDE